MNIRLKNSDEIKNSNVWKDFEILLDLMDNKTLSSFLRKWLSPHSTVGRMYFTCPGSRPGTGHGHHAYEGGLAKHSVCAARLAKTICLHYESLGHKIDVDLVVAGVLIHDIGKAWSYEPINEEQTEWKHTTESKHLHHIPIGHKELCRAVDSHNRDSYGIGHIPPISDALLLQLEHIILSHHGKISWSSPVTPRTPEAFVVHIIEMLDGFLEGKYFPGLPPRKLYMDN